MVTLIPDVSSQPQTDASQRRYGEVTAAERAEVAEKLLGVKLNVGGPVVDRAKVLLDIPSLRKKLRV